MNRIVIYGNAGSGKSTLARSYAESFGIAYLDLDRIAWDSPGVRREIERTLNDLRSFMLDHESWVVEGCYGGLIEEAIKSAEELLFLNPGVEVCLENCRSRSWEPHKYDSKEIQDEHLESLLAWVADYEKRTDEFSLEAHTALFDAFAGKKQELKTNAAAQQKRAAIASSSST